MRYIIPIITAVFLFTGFVAYPVLTVANEASIEQTKTQLFERLSKAKNEMEGRKIEHEIWEFWTAQAPSTKVHALLIRGMEKRREADYLWSEDLLDDVIELAPQYAEGWNQRAFTRFLQGNMESSLTDLEKALELEPLHFAAMSGMYHILISMGREKAAHSILAKAVAIHPWLKERGALPKSAPLEEPIDL